jgi:uncharacterized protein YbaR (Trm112 family)
VICPDCKGEGLVPVAFPHNRDVTAIICSRCDGAQEVPDETPEWMEKGRELKNKRISKRITLRRACVKLNLDPVMVSKMERGCIDPDPTLYDQLED